MAQCSTAVQYFKTEKKITIVRIDLAGPVFQKNSEKVRITLFTCMVYRAVHLELVSFLLTESFLLTLRRFIARRDGPK